MGFHWIAALFLWMDPTPLLSHSQRDSAGWWSSDSLHTLLHIYIICIYHVHSYASWHIVPRNFKPSAAQSLHLLWNSYPSSLAILFAKLMQLVRHEVHIKLLISQKIRCKFKCSNNDVISYILGIFDTLIIFERPRVTFSMQIKYRWYIWSRDQQYYCKNEEWHLKNR